MTGFKGNKGGQGLTAAVVVLVVVALLSGAVMLQYSIDRDTVTGRGLSDSSISETGRSILNVFGSVRQALAAYMWTRTDDLHHSYLGHNIMEAQPMFPYFWLITRLDPNFTMAFYYASYMLFRLGQPEEGFELAMEGLRHNPDSPLLHRNMAEIHLFFERDPERAEYHCLRAMELTTDEDEFATLSNLLSLIQDVLAGEREIPELSPLEESGEHHEHDHDEYCPDCER